ncbi:MAG TPA: archaeosortase/exosortase family protein, partial [Myxococcota bacterium]|nr:archaeosortase/exosortase family protein [Myxococcota bacterium]
MESGLKPIAQQIRGSEWVVAVALLAAFLPALVALARVWSSVDYYSHGFLVPLVAYWAAVHHSARFEILAARERRAAAPALGVALLYALATAAGSVSL